jgi:hypothetical protein
VRQDDTRLSQHPADRLIRELIRIGRQATGEEIQQIVEKAATAPFDTREVRVPQLLRGATYQGHTFTNRASCLLIHVAQRVLLDEQWSPGTTEGVYLSDLHQAIRHPLARLSIYVRHGGTIAGIFSPTTVPEARHGADTLPWTYVVYSADRGRIISGYQVSSLDEVNIPAGARWLT